MTHQITLMVMTLFFVKVFVMFGSIEGVLVYQYKLLKSLQNQLLSMFPD